VGAEKGKSASHLLKEGLGSEGKGGGETSIFWDDVAETRRV